MNKTLRKPKKLPIFPKLSRNVYECLEKKWYTRALFFTLLPIVYLIAVMVRLGMRIALIVHEAKYLFYGKHSPDYHKHLVHTYNALEVSAIYFLSLFFDFCRFLKRCWVNARIVREVTADGNSNAFSDDKGKLVIAFFVLIQNAIAGIKNGIIAIGKFISETLERAYRVKGSVIALTLVAFILIAAIIGVSADRNAKKEFSLNTQYEYEYYEVKPNDGWDKIAYKFKPDYMGIRDDFFTGSKYNYEYYLFLENPEAVERGLHPGMIIKCPVYNNIYTPANT